MMWVVRGAQAGLFVIILVVILRNIQLRHVRVPSNVDTLRMWGRIAMMLGVLGALIDLPAMLQSGSGLEALQAGLAQRMAFERAMLSLSLGLGTALLAIVAWVILRQMKKPLPEDLATDDGSVLESPSLDTDDTDTLTHGS